MNGSIIRTKGGRVYRCADCPYRSRKTGFCGFCMRKILDELKDEKNKGVSKWQDSTQCKRVSRK
jgi:hypothetical protein